MSKIGKNNTEVEHVLPAFGWQNMSWSPLSGGLINQTYLIQDSKGLPKAILQKLHRIFDGSVNKDIDFITKHLNATGLTTPLVLKTIDDKLYFENDSGTWRALTYLKGDTFHKTPSLHHARSAGRHVGLFHKTLASLKYDFAFKRSGVHDTAKHLKTLEQKIGTSNSDWSKDADNLAQRILESAKRLPPLSKVLPKRICHGDLKISNMLFKPNSSDALALVDLDTMGTQTLAYELGDALRSWCNLETENSKAPNPNFDVANAFLSGFSEAMASSLSEAEVKSIAIGYETICLELAARFCIDVYEDNYFGWNPEKFTSRREQNVIRAEGQFATSNHLSTKRNLLQEICMDSFRK